MAASNPLLLSNATRFKPFHIRSHSRSPSRSPIRKAEFTAHELDPLLGNLSPESTLQALSATEAPSTGGQKYQATLRASIANASTAERALGIKAALAAQKVRQWLAEINSWHWPDRKTHALGAGFVQPTDDGIERQRTAPHQEELYMGSLRADVVRQYEQRIEEIKDGLEALDVEDLKEHVLDAHIPSRSRPGTRDGLAEAATTRSEYDRLGDLTAVITATILQSLPYLAELNMLITIWDVRIAVLFEVPGLVQTLSMTKAAVEKALKDVCEEESSSSYTKSHVAATKERLQHEISGLAIRFDRALDLLEGREDCLPNSWIDDMDTIESDFGDWVVQAERRATRNHWRQQSGQPTAVKGVGQIAGPLEKPPTEGITASINYSTDPHSIDDQPALEDADEAHSAIKHNILPEHPALAAFKHRPVRKVSVKQSRIDSDIPSAETLLAGHRANDHESSVAAQKTTDVPKTAAVPPEDARGLDGDLPPEPTPDVPVLSYSPQQRGRLADLIALNQGKSAEEYQRGFVGLDCEDDPTFSGYENVQPEPFPFVSREPEKIHNRSNQKPPQKLSLASNSHRRGVSEVSLADSALSEAFSDISNAEIVDAKTTQVLASPKVSVIENPFRAGRDDFPNFTPNARPRVQSMHILGKDLPPTKPVVGGHHRPKSLTLTAIPSQTQGANAFPTPRKRSVGDAEIYSDGFSRPQILHRASTASIEFIPKGQVRRIDSSRKSSRDRNPVTPILVSPIDPNGSSADALRALTSSDSVRSVSSAGTERMNTTTPGELNTRDGMTGYYSQQVQPSSHPGAVARSRSGTSDTLGSNSPVVPGRSHKRLSRDVDDLVSSTDVDPQTSDLEDAPSPLPSTFSPFEVREHKLSSQNKSLPSEETLEAKIKDILVNLPTRIRLTSDPDLSVSPANQSSSDSTRSSTPAPSLTLSPVRRDRSSRRSNAGNSEVKVYHLIRNGQPRDTPPTKLHVRLVGENGERVMVRVGGGWADLAEYLREYSLHHGKRTIQEGRVEVANLPSGGVSASDTAGSSPIGPSLKPAKTRPTSRLDARSDFSALPSHNTGKARRSVTAPISAERKESRSSSPPPGETEAVRPPPVPVIPASFRQEHLPETTTNPPATTNSPNVITTVLSRDPSSSTSASITPSTPLTVYPAQGQNPVSATHPTTTTASTLSTPVSAVPSPSYTPLGAAGPKGGIKNAKPRAATFGSPAVSTPDNEAWVQGMIGKARQVSAQSNSSQVMTITDPNNTTTTSVSTPASRTVSTTANAALTSTPPSAKALATASISTPVTPDNARRAQTPSPSPSPAARNGKGSLGTEKPRSKSSMGIRRVFLRSKKPDKVG
jgi:hypothetical protein